MSHDERSPRLALIRGAAPAPAKAPPPPARRPDRGYSVAEGRFPPLGRPGAAALVFALLTGLVTHGYHLFQYPLYLTDEGIYMQRAWSLIRETRLSPYTYDYDHAPGGWITLAGWVFPLPDQFETFGTAINTGRFLMLLVHVASAFLLFEVVRRLSGGSVLAASVAAFLYNVSPLAIYYQRQVLLDNMMMFWVLLSLFALLRGENRLRDAMGGGLAFGIALITKENAIFFLPAFLYLLHRRIRLSANHRFARTLWPFAVAAPVAAYVMYAVLKNELLPSGLDFGLDNPPADHVSLLYTLWWQLNRNQGTLFTEDGLLYTSWLPRDGFLLLAGVVAVGVSLWWGARDRNRDLGFLVAGLLAFAYAFYLLRGSVVLDFYVAPLIPLFAMNIGMVAGRVLRRAHVSLRFALPVLTAGILVAAPTTGYFLTTNDEGEVQVADQYHLALTDMQDRQIAWVRENVPPDARIVTDEDLWSQFHDVRPFYPYAHSHWNAASDPDVRDKLFGKKWRNIDYIVASNRMRKSIVGNNGDGRADWILKALDNSERVWTASQGEIRLEIYRVNG